MTREKAIRIIKAMRQYWDVNSYCPNAHALDMSIDALQKQIPMKPNIQKGDLVEYYYCPVCDKFYGKKGTHNVGLFDKYIYCNKCGQKIDWSDKE